MEGSEHLDNVPNHPTTNLFLFQDIFAKNRKKVVPSLIGKYYIFFKELYFS